MALTQEPCGLRTSTLHPLAHPTKVKGTQQKLKEEHAPGSQTCGHSCRPHRTAPQQRGRTAWPAARYRAAVQQYDNDREAVQQYEQYNGMVGRGDGHASKVLQGPLCITYGKFESVISLDNLDKRIRAVACVAGQGCSLCC